MLTIQGRVRKLCDRSSRREFLRVGSIAGLGLSLPDLLQSAAASSSTPSGFGRAKRCILLFPFGGPSQLDSFDPKPNAPDVYRGEFRPISTRVPSVQISELFPRLAQQADTFTIVRSVTHSDSVHTSAGYTMLTGKRHPRANDPAGASVIRPAPDDYPHIGSVVAYARGSQSGLPPFVTLPESVHDAGVNELPGQGAGFLGGRYAPLLFEADARRAGFPPPDVFRPAGIDAGRLDVRQALRVQLDRRLAAFETSGQLASLDAHYQRAFDLLRSPAARRAFDLEAEAPTERDAYGRHLFGQGCLLARRLVEAGVALVSVYWHYEGPDDSPCWDTHENNFRHMRERLAPPADRAFARLLEDLSERGLLDDTLVVWMGEFGRSPRINPKAGRDHWPHVQSVLLAGGGVAGGGVYGKSDKHGGYPADQPVTPADLGATLLHLLGIPPETELHDQLGRTFTASHGTPIRALFA
jgi:Protein of unknown function (DUF1501)